MAGREEWLVIDFSIGQNRFNEKSQDVICIFELFEEAEGGLMAVVCIDRIKEQRGSVVLYELAL